jgi:hypothetical protein
MKVVGIPKILAKKSVEDTKTHPKRPQPLATELTKFKTNNARTCFVFCCKLAQMHVVLPFCFYFSVVPCFFLGPPPKGESR